MAFLKVVAEARAPPLISHSLLSRTPRRREKKRKGGTHDILLDLFEGGDEQDDPEREDGREPVRRRDVRDLLDRGDKEEKDVGVL